MPLSGEPDQGLDGECNFATVRAGAPPTGMDLPRCGAHEQPNDDGWFLSVSERNGKNSKSIRYMESVTDKVALSYKAQS